MIVECVNCKSKLNIQDSMQGKKGKCPRCGEIFEIPFEVEAVEIEEALQTSIEGTNNEEQGGSGLKSDQAFQSITKTLAGEEQQGTTPSKESHIDKSISSPKQSLFKRFLNLPLRFLQKTLLITPQTPVANRRLKYAGVLIIILGFFISDLIEDILLIVSLGATQVGDFLNEFSLFIIETIPIFLIYIVARQKIDFTDDDKLIDAFHITRFGRLFKDEPMGGTLYFTQSKIIFEEVSIGEKPGENEEIPFDEMASVEVGKRYLNLHTMLIRMKNGETTFRFGSSKKPIEIMISAIKEGIAGREVKIDKSDLPRKYTKKSGGLSQNAWWITLCAASLVLFLLIAY